MQGITIKTKLYAGLAKINVVKAVLMMVKRAIVWFTHLILLDTMGNLSICNNGFYPNCQQC